MPNTKYSSSKKLQTSHERLVIIDELLGSGISIKNRDRFCSLVNVRLDKGKKITKESLDKDLKAIRQKLSESAPTVELKSSKDRGYYYSEKGFRLFESFSILEEDKPAVYLAKDLFQLLKGSSLEPKFNQIVDQILEISFGKDISKEERQYISLINNKPDNGSKWVEKILKAIYQKETLLINYRSRNKPAHERHISPYLLRYYDDRWYMIAYDHNSIHSQKELVFSLSSIDSVNFSNKQFIPASFNILDYFKYSLGIWHEHSVEPINVKLSFSQYQDYIKSVPIHHSQTSYVEDKTGNLIIEFTVYPSPELKMLIMKYSDKVKVLEPASLVEEIKQKIENMRKMYL